MTPEAPGFAGGQRAAKMDGAAHDGARWLVGTPRPLSLAWDPGLLVPRVRYSSDWVKGSAHGSFECG